MNKNIISFATDSNYISYAVKLLASLKRVGSEADVLCRCVDMDDISDICRAYPEIKIKHDNPGLSKKRTLLKNLGMALPYTYKGNFNTTQGIDNIRKTLYSPRAAYTCHSRFKTIVELLELGYECIVYIDADTIFNKCIDALFESTEYDLRVVPTTHAGKTYMFRNEGLLVINNRDYIHEYFTTVRDHIFNGDDYIDWDIDSLALQQFYSEEIKVGLLDDKFKDRLHHHESYMWSGDGINKYKDTFEWNQ
jgi:hypothetical protein